MSLELVKKYNKAYREGNALVSDKEYDTLYDKLSESEKSEIGVGLEVDSDNSRKRRLPKPMFSLAKVKNLIELHKWMKSKDIPMNTKFVLTPKYDGLSFLNKYPTNESYTRGNGVYGQRSDTHYSTIQSNLTSLPLVPELENEYVFGEIIMSKSKFKNKYSNDFKNPRNLVAGLMNVKVPTLSLEDVDFIRFGIFNDNFNKSETLDILNEVNHVKVPYVTGNIDIFTESYLNELYKSWSTNYNIDGLVLEVNDCKLRNKLGRDKNGNPIYARAYKGFDTTSKTTTILDIEWGVGKDGRLSPVFVLDPIDIDGSTISRVTGINAKFVQDNNFSISDEVGIIKSGDIIPKIITLNGKSIV